MSGYIAAEAALFHTNVEFVRKKRNRKQFLLNKALTVSCSRSFNSCAGNSGSEKRMIKQYAGHSPSEDERQLVAPTAEAQGCTQPESTENTHVYLDT